MKALVEAFNQEKALVGAFSVIVQLHRLIVYSTINTACAAASRTGRGCGGRGSTPRRCGWRRCRGWWTGGGSSVYTLVMEVTRYHDNPLVVAMDLRNELRAAHHHYPTWGDGQVGR